MPTLYQSDFAKKTLTTPNAQGGEVLAVHAYVIVGAALAAADVMEAVILPADHVPIEVILDSDRLDTNGAPTLTLDVGLMSGTAGLNDPTRTVGNQFLAASVIAQTAGNAIATSAKSSGQRILPSVADRGIGIKAAAGAATGVATLTNLTVNRGQWAANTAYTANDFVTLPTGVRVKCTTTGVSGVTNPFDGTALYNTTVNDGTAVWTIADPVVGLTLLYKAAQRGS